MKIKFLIAMMTLSLSCFGFAESTQNNSAESNALQPLNDVRISMQRMLKSSEGRYFMSLYAGITNPHATLIDLMEGSVVEFRGSQKGDQLNLNSVPSDQETTKNDTYQLSATLNANSGIMKGLLTSKDDTFGKSVQFEPAFKIANKPVFVFKFYGQYDVNNTYGKALKRVDVLNKNNNSVLQSLTGFTAYPSSMGYMDINFDGYYDVILSDLSQGYTVEDKRYIYWMYNPKTNLFQRSPQLEKIIGFPSLHGEKQQIDFGDGQIYQVENGLLNRL